MQCFISDFAVKHDFPPLVNLTLLSMLLHNVTGGIYVIFIFNQQVHY